MGILGRAGGGVLRTDHPGQHAQDVLDALAVGIGDRAARRVLDAEIKGFFDTISHACIMACAAARADVAQWCASLRNYGCSVRSTMFGSEF